MSPNNQSSSEATPLLGSSRPAGLSREGMSRGKSRFLPETLLIPVAFATTLAAAIPSTTFIELERRAVCELWSITHGNLATFPAGGSVTPELCDTPEVARYFATVIAILGTTESIISMAMFGILSRILSHHRRKPALLFILVTRIMGSCLIPGSQYVPGWLAGRVFFTGMAFELFSGLLPYGYLLHLYIVDVCNPEDRTIALSKIIGWASLGTCISFALGGFITTKTGNPLIVFHIAAAIFVAAFIYVALVLPESFQEEKQNELSHVCSEPSTEGPPKSSLLAPFLLVFAPLKMFIPTRNWRLTWCGVHIFVFMVAHAYSSTAWLVLATSRYHLTPANTGLFLTSDSISSAIVSMLIVPSVIRFLRPYYSRRILLTEEDISNGREMELETSDRLEVHLAFLSCVVAAVFFLSAAAFTTNKALIISGICLGFTSMHGPTIRSLVAGSVDPLKQGEALAAIEMVTKAGMVLSFIIMGSIFMETIDTMPLLLFYVHLVIMLISGALLFLIRDTDRYQKPLES